MSLVTLTALAVLTVTAGEFKAPAGPAIEAAAMLEDALGQSDAAGLERAVKQALGKLEPHSPAATTLEDALKTAAEQLTATVKEVVADLRFQPKHEAELPVGFPTYTPVGAIEVKKYPQYRKATSSGFWRLFMHIKTNSIAMTAPVEMSYTKKGDGLNQADMAFLYGKPTIGKVNKDGTVKVSDVQPQHVVSVGVRGSTSSKVVQEKAARLRKWIEANELYEADGDVRVMGYNSPMVPNARKYFEVQIPVKVTPAGETTTR